MLPLEETPLVTLKLLPRKLIPTWLPSEFNSISGGFRLTHHRLCGRPKEHLLECTGRSRCGVFLAGEVVLGVCGHSVMSAVFGDDPEDGG